MAYYTKCCCGRKRSYNRSADWAIYIRGGSVLSSRPWHYRLSISQVPAADGASDTPVSLIALGIYRVLPVLRLFFLLVAWNRRKTTEIVVTTDG